MSRIVPEGKFKLSDGTIIDRAEAKTRFGQERPNGCRYIGGD